MSHARVNPPPFNSLTRFYTGEESLAWPFSVSLEAIQRIQTRDDGWTQNAQFVDLIGGGASATHGTGDPPSPSTTDTWLDREGAALDITYNWEFILGVGSLVCNSQTRIKLGETKADSTGTLYPRIDFQGKTFIKFNDDSEARLDFSSNRGNVGGDEASSFGTAKLDDGTGTLYDVPMWIDITGIDFAFVTSYYTIDYLTMIPTVYITS